MPAASNFWQLTLYIVGSTPKSMVAEKNLKRYCHEYMENRYELEIIDLKKDPQLAEKDEVLAIPTLIRKKPKPVKRIIGDLSNMEKVLIALECLPKKN